MASQKCLYLITTSGANVDLKIGHEQFQQINISAHGMDYILESKLTKRDNSSLANTDISRQSDSGGLVRK